MFFKWHLWFFICAVKGRESRQVSWAFFKSSVRSTVFIIILTNMHVNINKIQMYVKCGVNQLSSQISVFGTDLLGWCFSSEQPAGVQNKVTSWV